MPDSYALELREIIDRAFSVEHSGRATAQMVHATVQSDLPEHLVDYLIGKGIRSQVNAYFNAKDDDGLPKRPEVNAAGEHAQLDFASVTEFSYVHAKYVDRADANRAQAEKVRQRCLAVHQVDIDATASSAA